MKISQLEAVLKEIREQRGDLEVFMAGHPGEIGTEITEDSLNVFLVDDQDRLKSKVPVGNNVLMVIA